MHEIDNAATQLGSTILCEHTARLVSTPPVLASHMVRRVQ